MNVAVVAPHPDDETLGCGGSIRLHADQGDQISVIFLTSGELALGHLPAEEARRIREREADEAAAVLGATSTVFLRGPDWTVGDTIETLAMALRPILADQAPAIIYLPHAGEWHPDHAAALPLVSAAIRNWGGNVPQLLSYEVWTPLSAYGCVRDITSVMEQKMTAVRCYQSQLQSFRYDRAILGLDKYRGALAGHCDYAEVFGQPTLDV
jgi:LmbE family N-acetylglucosaminyl deacetylase